MRIILEPQVKLVSVANWKPRSIEDFFQAHQVGPQAAQPWLDNAYYPNDRLPELAGRLCYMSFEKPRPGGNEAYLAHIKEVGHGSVLEHSYWMFLAWDVSRSLTHELVRHRSGMGYSQLSQRYVDESTAEFVEPDEIAADPELHCLWEDAVRHAHEAYVKIVDKMFAKYGEQIKQNTHEQNKQIRKIVRQAARSVLPNATETKIAVSCNNRSLRHFIEMRASRHADVEIRRLAYKMFAIAREHAPNVFADYTGVQLTDGTYEVVTKHRKI